MSRLEKVIHWEMMNIEWAHTLGVPSYCQTSPPFIPRQSQTVFWSGMVVVVVGLLSDWEPLPSAPREQF